MMPIPTEVPQQNRDEYLSTRKAPPGEEDADDDSIGDPDHQNENDFLFNDTKPGHYSYHTFSLNAAT